MTLAHLVEEAETGVLYFIEGWNYLRHYVHVRQLQ